MNSLKRMMAPSHQFEPPDRRSVSHPTRVSLILCVLICLASVCQHVSADVIAIENVEIETRGEAGRIDGGIVVIRDGVIESVGKDVKIPEDAMVINGAGATLTPGLIDSQSRLWLTNTSLSDTSSTAALRTVDGLDPFDESFHEVVGQGVTSVAIAPQDRGRLGGSVALVAAAPTSDVFDIPTRESFEEKTDNVDSETSEPAKESDKKASAAKVKARTRQTKKPAEKGSKSTLAASLRADEESDKDKDSEDSPEKSKDDEKKSDEKKDKSDDESEKDDEETIEVPYSIARPPVPYTSGKTGWVLSSDAAMQASLGIAATDGRSRISEFDALKKALTDAESYHKKWDEYRSWKAKQDKLPPDQRAKVETKKPMTVAEKRAEFMRRVAAMRAARSGAAAKPAEPKKETEGEKKADEKKSDSKSGEKKDDKKDKVVPKPDFDPVKERLRPVLKGKIPLRLAVTDNASLKRALELTKIADCQLVLVGASDLSPGSLDDVNWPLIAGPWVGQEDDTVAFWIEQIEQNDSRVCLGTFGGRGYDSGTLRMQAAAAIAAGVDRDVVLDSVTRSAAEVAGVGNWLGKIEPGYRADLALFAGDPLDPSTPVIQTMVAGKTVFESSVKADSSVDQDVVAVDEELLARLSDLSMPSSYVLASNRILRPSGKFRSGRVTIVDGVVKAVDLDPVKSSSDEPDEKPVDDALPVLNLGDLVLTPGLVTAQLSLSSGVSTSEPDSSYYKAANGFDFQSETTRRMVRSGVLLAAIAPPSSNVMAGQIAAARLAAEEPILATSIADKMVVSAAARRTDRFPASMEGQFEFIRRRFRGELEPNRTEMPAVVAEAMRQDSQTRFEALGAGKRIAVIEAQTPAELRGSLRLIESLGLDARLLLPSDLKSVLPQIKTQKLGLIVRTARASDPDWYLGDIIQAASSGSRVGIAAQDAFSLRSTAAMMVGKGVRPQRALRILTTEAAACVGMPKGSATIAPGQPADLVIWSGPPYKLTSRCLTVLSDGKTIDQDDPAMGDLSAKAVSTRGPQS
ncbi:MAG: amidohydrolase family protein [Planctomycetota bacterium]